MKVRINIPPSLAEKLKSEWMKRFSEWYKNHPRCEPSPDFPGTFENRYFGFTETEDGFGWLRSSGTWFWVDTTRGEQGVYTLYINGRRHSAIEWLNNHLEGLKSCSFSYEETQERNIPWWKTTTE